MPGAKLWVVMAREYLERVRTKWFIVATVFGPILFGGLIFVPPWIAAHSKASSDVARIAILDGTGTTLGAHVAAQLNGGITGDTSRTIVRMVPHGALAAAESLATRETIAGRIRGYLVLDSATLAGESARYAGTNATSGPDMARIRQVVREESMILRLENAGVNPFESAAITHAHLNLDTQRITPSGRGGSAVVSAYLAITVSLLLYISILLYGQSVLRSVIEEKQSRVAEVVVSSVSPVTLLGGKVLGVGAVGLTQMGIWMATSVALLHFRARLLALVGLGANPMQLPEISVAGAVVLLLFFVLGYTFYAALFAAIASTVSNEQDAQQAQMPVVMLLVISAVFLGPALNAPESMLARVLGGLPFSAPIVMPLRMSVTSLSPIDIGASLCILAGSCYIAVRLAARVYRVGLLMYGKRPAFREILRWMARAG